MEIALVNNSSIRIKGKNGSVIINPTGKAIDANGFISLDGFDVDTEKLSDDALVIKGSGEYEFGGIKVSGFRLATDVIYTLKVDKIEILLGNASVLEREYSKLNEHNIVLLYNTNTVDPSFVTSVSTNVAIFYGEKAEDNIKLLAKEEFRTESKYSVTFEKLPQEVEKILLQ